MDRWEFAVTVAINKLCHARQHGKQCRHSACDEATTVIDQLQAHVFSDAARHLMTNKLCNEARWGGTCGHAACEEAMTVLQSFDS